MPERKLGEDKLPEGESLLSTYLSSSTLGFSILDTQFRYIAVNEALATMNGLTRQDHLGRTIREVLGSLADQIEPELKKLLATGEPQLDVHVSGVLPRESETRHWIRHFFPIRRGEEGVSRIGCIVLEVTQQKAMETAVHHLSKSMKLQMDRLQMLLDVGSLLAANWNVEQVFPTISARIRRILGHEYA